MKLLERSLDFIKQIKDYGADVVFFGIDVSNLLPVIPDPNNGRKFYHDEPESIKEGKVLDEKFI